MPIIYPANRKEVFDRIATDIQAELPVSEPFLRNSYLRALGIGYAGGCYDIYKTEEELEKEMFMDTATGEYLERWGSFKSIYRNAATQSIGYVTATGVPTTVIPINTTLQSSDGNQYLTLAASSIQTNVLTIPAGGMTRSGSLVTVTFAPTTEHHLANGNIVTISGADQTEYNGTHQIVVTAINKFTFEISTTPATPATGTITASLNYANLSVRSIGYGVNTNLESGSELFFTSTIPGVDSSAFVQYEGLTGGTDLESDADYRKRVLYAYQHPIAYFNVAEIVTWCQQINGTTRVFVHEITPDVGQVTIYFMRDNDDNPIPSASQVIAMKNHLLLIKPAHVDPNDVIVLAPTPKIINFKFSLIDPSTDTMKAAITNNLSAFFSEVPEVGVPLSKNSYASIIYSTVDLTTGDTVKNFSLSEPIGDIMVLGNEIAILGTVTF